MNSKTKKNLIILVTVQLIVLFCLMWFKTGFHMDEIWSYSLANSLDGMYFYPLGFDESKSTNLWNQWTEGSVLLYAEMY